MSTIKELVFQFVIKVRLMSVCRHLVNKVSHQYSELESELQSNIRRSGVSSKGIFKRMLLSCLVFALVLSVAINFE